MTTLDLLNLLLLVINLLLVCGFLFVKGTLEINIEIANKNNDEEDDDDETEETGESNNE